MLERQKPSPDCEWCEGTGYRAHHPAAWYRVNRERSTMQTTIFPCQCRMDQDDTAEDEQSDSQT